jgi:hypothetical protein
MISEIELLGGLRIYFLKVRLQRLGALRIKQEFYNLGSLGDDILKPNWKS